MSLVQKILDWKRVGEVDEMGLGFNRGLEQAAKVVEEYSEVTEDLPTPLIGHARSSTSEALSMLERLHRSKLDYDEYVVLHDAFKQLSGILDKHEQFLSDIKEVIDDLSRKTK